MDRVLGPALAVAVVCCAKQVIDPISAEIDFADPKSVTGGVFYAARSGDPAPLARLCDPAGASEESVARICRLSPDGDEWASFRREFGSARLNGEPRVHDDHAALNFVFGADATLSETMELVRRDGRWYLLRL